MDPDRVAMQDATAQMALLQFMTAGRDEVAVPSTVHCDHLIRPRSAPRPTSTRRQRHQPRGVRLPRSVSAKYGIGFWKPGSGIIHQVVLENYAFPGGMMIGTDSHTPNAGGLGMVAIGVGGADAVDVMTGFPGRSCWPKLIGVKLTGTSTAGRAPKDVILKVCEHPHGQGRHQRHRRVLRPRRASISSATGKATICNMGAEHRRHHLVFGYDDNMATYLRATGREAIAELADAHAPPPAPRPEVEANPAVLRPRHRDRPLDPGAPHQRPPHPRPRPRSSPRWRRGPRGERLAARISAALIGSCTNSSYEDITRAAHVARQAPAHGPEGEGAVHGHPGSEQIYATIERDGLLADLEAIGATVLANACGPCIGQWRRDDVKKGEVNTIVNSFNRNFPKRNDGNPTRCRSSAPPSWSRRWPWPVTLDFNPHDRQPHRADGSRSSSRARSAGAAGHGLRPRASTASPPRPMTQRRASRSPSPELRPPGAARSRSPWDGKDYLNLPVLVKAQGKCTTDHISAAGPWLKYRGSPHEHLRQPVVRRAQRETGENGVGVAKDQLTASAPLTPTSPSSTRPAAGWVAIGDENYGEGSSREHAAMEPRHRAAVVLIVRSFARIHETNLKKQGILPLTFADPADYDLVPGRAGKAGPRQAADDGAAPHGRHEGGRGARAHLHRRADLVVPRRVGAQQDQVRRALRRPGPELVTAAASRGGAAASFRGMARVGRPCPGRPYLVDLEYRFQLINR
jgi:aconitate hydratase